MSITITDPPMTADRYRDTRLADFGDVMQLAFVPADIDAAVRFWTEVMRVGPFVRRAHMRYPGALYRGTPTDVEFSVYIAYWGDIQIELIEQHNDAPSIYSAWRKAGTEGLQHVCIVVDDIAAARAECERRGLSVEQEIPWAGGGAIYVDTGGGPGTMVEMIQTSPEMEARFAKAKLAARTWDGSDPVRDP